MIFTSPSLKVWCQTFFRLSRFFLHHFNRWLGDAVVEDPGREEWHFTLVENRHAAAGHGHDLVREEMDVEPLHAVRHHIFEAKTGEVPGAGGNAAEGCFGTHSTGKAAMNSLLFQRLSAMRMFLTEESYTPDKYFEKVKMFRIAGHRVSRVLETSQLHLGLQRGSSRTGEVAALP